MTSQPRILGRALSLWGALFTAAVNVAVIVFAVPLNAAQVGALNICALAFLAVLGNETTPGTAPTFSSDIKGSHVEVVEAPAEPPKGTHP